MSNPRLLIVDDEQETRHTLNDYLSKRMECDVVEAADGYQAIEELRKNSFDLILLDIKMPGLSGIEVIKETRKVSSTMPIIVLTKWDSSEVAAEVKQSGAEYIPKPFSLKVVHNKVEEKLKSINKFSPKR